MQRIILGVLLLAKLGPLYAYVECKMFGLWVITSPLWQQALNDWQFQFWTPIHYCILRGDALVRRGAAFFPRNCCIAPRTCLISPGQCFPAPSHCYFPRDCLKIPGNCAHSPGQFAHAPGHCIFPRKCSKTPRTCVQSGVLRWNSEELPKAYLVCTRSFWQCVADKFSTKFVCILSIQCSFH